MTNPTAIAVLRDAVRAIHWRNSTHLCVGDGAVSDHQVSREERQR
ncbi:hypothetical protein [Halocatena marina]|uniref:Uncharacterized protein n=1 Tax=Halocatena marina TaxID=2934937 RepID=A0ABD5YX54_9EURY|nr:hypothetical protein [Halocatena marina]